VRVSWSQEASVSVPGMYQELQVCGLVLQARVSFPIVPMMCSFTFIFSTCTGWPTKRAFIIILSHLKQPRTQTLRRRRMREHLRSRHQVPSSRRTVHEMHGPRMSQGRCH
jgi:hypothetical protein